MRKCLNCGRQIEAARVKLLDSLVCAKCAHDMAKRAKTSQLACAPALKPRALTPRFPKVKVDVVYDA